ncbi:Nn.00g053860.m01.CDS01 [Neocucurbitaria sp. VM-36]
MATTSPSTAPSSTAATPNPAADKALRTGAIIGGVVGGLAVIGAVIIILYWIRRRHPKPSHATPTKENDADMEGAPSTYRQHNNEGSKNDDDTGTSAYYAHGRRRWMGESIRFMNCLLGASEERKKKSNVDVAQNASAEGEEVVRDGDSYLLPVLHHRHSFDPRTRLFDSIRLAWIKATKAGSFSKFAT